MSSSSFTTLSEEVPTPNSKLRCLKLKWHHRIVNILSVNNRWLEVASNVRKPDDKTQFLYSDSDISKISNESAPAERFLQEWSITGRVQPTIQDLFNVMIDSELYQAADCLSKELFKVPLGYASNNNDLKEEKELFSSAYKTVSKEDEHCDNIPISAISKDTCVDKDNEIDPNQEGTSPAELEKQEQRSEESIFQLSGMKSYRYSVLAEVTGNFCDIFVYNNGFKLGEGGFGVVYRAYVKDEWIAIKKLKDAVDDQFFNELGVLSLYKHENLIPLLGYSNDGPYCCLIYLYMQKGSLLERLACVNDWSPVSWEERFHITLGTARGIHHLHTFRLPPLIHRDIKSANILLDDNMIARIGDFGLARSGNSESMKTAFTSNICGTAVYMAPEASLGEVSIKMDSYSFGVVLLELLTGLPPFDPTRDEDKDLISYMEENCSETEDIVEMLDAKAGSWNKEAAISLYGIAKRCITPRKKNRPTIAEILPEIVRIADAASGS